MRPSAFFRFVGPRGFRVAVRTALAVLAALVLPAVLAGWPPAADAAPRKSHAAAKPAAKKGKAVAKPRYLRAAPRPARKPGAPRAQSPRPVTATPLAAPPVARPDPLRTRRPAATVKDPGTRDEGPSARVACERDGRIYLLADCARPEVPPLRPSEALAEAR